MALPSLGKIRAKAVFVATESALFTRSPAGRLALLPGSHTKTGYKDGQGNKARFNWLTAAA